MREELLNRCDVLETVFDKQDVSMLDNWHKLTSPNSSHRIQIAADQPALDDTLALKGSHWDA